MHNSRGPRSATPKDTPLNSKQRADDAPSRRRKTRMLHIRVTPEEEERAVSAAKALSIRLGTFCRFAVLHVAGAPTREEYEALRIDDVIGHLDKIGNNLNQLARAANRGKIEMSNADRLMLLELRENITEARAVFLAWREAVKTRSAKIVLPKPTRRRPKT